MRAARSFAPVLALLLLASCASAPTWQQVDARPELIAFALASSYAVVQGAAADLAEDPATPAELRRALIAADEAALPIVMRLRPLAEEMVALREEFAEGNIDASRLRTGITNLDAAIADAAPVLQALLDLIRGGR